MLASRENWFLEGKLIVKHYVTFFFHLPCRRLLALYSKESNVATKESLLVPIDIYSSACLFFTFFFPSSTPHRYQLSSKNPRLMRKYIFSFSFSVFFCSVFFLCVPKPSSRKYIYLFILFSLVKQRLFFSSFFCHPFVIVSLVKIQLLLLLFCRLSDRDLIHCRWRSKVIYFAIIIIKASLYNNQPSTACIRDG